MTTGWFNPTAWHPTLYKQRGVYVSPPSSDNPFAVGDSVGTTPVPAPWEAAPPAPIIPQYEIPVYQPQPAIAPMTGFAGFTDADGQDKGRTLDLPPAVPPMAIPGLVGELAEACWNGAPWQIAEVAIASALSTMSLLCSRTYRHGTLGLSLYLLVLAQTSTGKSFAYTANDRWFNELHKFFEGIKPPHYEEAKKRLAQAKKMIIGQIGSAQGLAQHIAECPATLYHADEYVADIKLMSQQNCPANKLQERSELLRLMEMSGPGRVYRGRKYSKRSNLPEEIDVLMASLSILATGTPEAFYNDISGDLLTTGFLPRFTVLEYEGNLTAPNPNPVSTLNPKMFEQIKTLYNQSYSRGQQLTGDVEQVIDVKPIDDLAIGRLKWFENVCIRSTVEDNERELPTSGMWSRAKEHVKQIASLIAIGVNPYNPRIEASHVDIAIKIVMPCVQKICKKFSSGEIGVTDDRRQAEIRKFIVKLYIHGSRKFGKLPGVKPELLDNGVIQAYVVRNYCRALLPFKGHPLGAARAFNDAWADMIKYGELIRKEYNGSVDACVTLNMDIFAPLMREHRGL